MSGKASRVQPNAKPPPGPIGNTTGMIVPDTAPNPKPNTAPAIKPTEKEKGWWERWGSSAVHIGLDVVGLIPGVGEIADGANALIYLAEGDKVNAALSAAAMIPGAGMAATGAKYAKKAAGVAVEAGAKLSKEAAEKLAKEAAEKAAKEKAEKEAAEAAAKRKGGKDLGETSPCRLFAIAIFAKTPEVAKRFIDMMEDKLGIFKLTVNPDGTKGRPHPSLPKGSGTWHGHDQQLRQKQKSLRDEISAYDAAKCQQPKIPKPIRELAYLPIPIKPGGTIGYPFTALPK
jgi:hypothetical protein